MFNRTVTAGIAIIAAAAGTASAGTIRAYYTPFQAGNGGEFRLVNLTGNAGKRGMMSDITAIHAYNLAGGDGSTVGYASQDDFQSFCLERTEHIANNTVYSFKVSNAAENGGYGGGNPDPIGHATGWIYSHFRNGTLSNYSYNGVEGAATWAAGGTDEAKRERSARTLQTAIWFLEGELRSTSSGHAMLTTLPGTAPSNNQYNNPNGLNQDEWDQLLAWVNAANNAVTNGYINTPVKALNLFVDANQNGRFDDGDTIAQSQLTLIPLPSAAGLALAGMGLLVRRRNRA